MNQYLRRCKITISSDSYSLEINQSLRISFRITPSIDFKPDEAVIDIYNLQNKTITDIRRDFTDIQLDVGYKNTTLSSIYLGQIRSIRSIRSGADIITSITAGAGDRQLRTSNINATDNTKTLLRQIDKIRESMGLRKGAYVGIDSEPKSKRPVVLTGSSFSALSKLARKYDFHWFINSNRLYVIKDNDYIKSEVVLQSTRNLNTGLIGLPEQSEEGLVSFKSLLNADIKVGSSVQIILDKGKQYHLFENGRFRVNKMIYEGDTHSTKWYSEVTEAARISLKNKVLLNNYERNSRITS